MSASSRTASLALYRDILRTHRRLPPGLRYMGDRYVKDEFRKHAKADTKFVPQFLDQWTEYLRTLKLQTMLARPELVLGRTLEKETIETLSDQQVGQLYVLREETKNVGKKKKDGEDK